MIRAEQQEPSRYERFKDKLQTRYLNFLKAIGLQRTSAKVVNYVTVSLIEQVRAVLPMFFFLVVLRGLFLRSPVEEVGTIFLGLLATVVGLFMFLEGLKDALMPMGQLVGQFLPEKFSLLVVLVVSFILGVLVTYAEPAVASLLPLGALVEVATTPYLYAMLHGGKEVLVLSIGLGVGVAALVGILSFTKRWSLKPMILIPLIPALLISIYMQWAKPELAPVVGLAWDCGAVTTGPVTVPIILALGIGTTKKKSASGRVSSKAENHLAGLGLVTLASLYPVLFVQIFAVFYSFFTTEDEILASAQDEDSTNPSIFDVTPLSETIFGIRAVFPLVMFLIFVIKFLLKEDLPTKSVQEVIGEKVPSSSLSGSSSSSLSGLKESGDTVLTSSKGFSIDEDEPDFSSVSQSTVRTYRSRGEWTRAKIVYLVGLLSAQIGIIIFFCGITFGLKLIGEQVGISLPVLFLHTDADEHSPYYSYSAGLFFLVVLVWVLGLLVTLAEPALQVLGEKVEELTGGSFKKMYLVFAVAIGVGLGMVIGVLRILYDVKLTVLILIGYSIAYFLTLFSKEEFVRIAWDSAGVTTGPVTVPFVLSLGLHFGNAANAVDGFGILTCASFAPIVCVLFVGVCIRIYERISGKNAPRNFEELQNLVPFDNDSL